MIFVSIESPLRPPAGLSGEPRKAAFIEGMQAAEALAKKLGIEVVHRRIYEA